jgi:hypothetical protein
MSSLNVQESSSAPKTLGGSSNARCQQILADTNLRLRLYLGSYLLVEACNACPRATGAYTTGWALHMGTKGVEARTHEHEDQEDLLQCLVPLQDALEHPARAVATT